MARISALRRQKPDTVPRSRPATPDFEAIEPVRAPLPEPDIHTDPVGERPLPLLMAETSLWSLGLTAFVLAPMAATAIAVAPLMLAKKLLPTKLFS